MTYKRRALTYYYALFSLRSSLSLSVLNLKNKMYYITFFSSHNCVTYALYRNQFFFICCIQYYIYRTTVFPKITFKRVPPLLYYSIYPQKCAQAIILCFFFKLFRPLVHIVKTFWDRFFRIRNERRIENLVVYLV